MLLDPGFFLAYFSSFILRPAIELLRDAYNDIVNAMRIIIRPSTDTDSRILVAAAGNRSLQTDTGLETCREDSDLKMNNGKYRMFPAELGGVYAIGATKRPPAFEVASYSAVPDDTGRGQGLWTLGGEDDEISYMNTAVLGISPSNPNNLLSVGWWSGTSVAAAIATGALACFLSTGQTFKAFRSKFDKHKIGNTPYLKVYQPSITKGKV